MDTIITSFSKLRRNDILDENIDGLVRIFFVGHFFYNGVMYHKGNVLNLFKSYRGDISDLARSLNGNFAFFLQKPGTAIVCVDKVRSIPLFYSIHRNQTYISDDPYWIKQKLGHVEKDALFVKEFVNTGYVAGRNTLYPNIFQVQAGECITFSDGDLESRRYYEYIYGSDLFALEKGELLEAMEQMYLRVFERMVKQLGGRPICLPLSGGFDSRLIALMLKKFDYKNVVAFSYGKANNAEAVVSRNIAESLGFRWIFVEYTREMWGRLYRDGLRAEYDVYADGCSVISHLQDYPAVLHMKTNALIDSDSVFVPGHGGDVVGLANMPLDINGHDNTMQTLADLVVGRHYTLQGTRLSDEERALFVTRVRHVMQEMFGECSRLDSALAYWSWQERQSKFINNSVRVYEFFGYDYLLPLWDDEILDFYSRVPLNYKLGKNLLVQYLASIGAPYIDKKTSNVPLERKLLQHVKKSAPFLFRGAQHAVRWGRKRRYRKEYTEHFLEWYGIMSEKEFKQIYNGVNWNCHYLYRTLERVGELQMNCERKGGN